MLRFDANLRWLFTESPMLERYEQAAASGFRGVEVAFPYEFPAREIAARLQANGLALVQILSPFSWDAGERGIAALPGRQDEFRESLRRAVDYAAETGGPLIHVMPGRIPAGADRRPYADRFLENLGWAADRAGAAGLSLVLEPCCRDRIPDFLYHRLGDAARFIDQLARPNIRLCFDTFHVQMEEASLEQALQAYWPYLGHIQVGDVPGRHEPGSGGLPFPRLMRAVEERGWTGWIGCEYEPSGHTLDTLAWGAAFGLRDPRPAAAPRP